MVDSRKVFNGLKCCAASTCLSCPYDYRDLHCMVKLATDALVLLEEQTDIIRCKDCRNSERIGSNRYRCFMWSYNFVLADGFCNYGERKDNHDD